MQDQVHALNEKGVAAAAISSGNGDRVNREIMERLLGRSLLARPQKSKPSDEKPFEHLTIVYVTPEQVQTSRFREALIEIHKKKQLSLFAVDEAHWYVTQKVCCALSALFQTVTYNRSQCPRSVLAIAFQAGDTTFVNPICVSIIFEIRSLMSL
jgi:hypothetical protein